MMKATLPLSPGVLNPLSLKFAGHVDGCGAVIFLRSCLPDGIELDSIRSKNEGEETLGLGRQTARRISQPNPARQTPTAGPRPELGYMPVRPTLRKDEKEVLRMEPRAVERP
ncbi:MAG: hypothetical protein IPK09_00010 [Candidatus Competibacteraceae bacterium]|nr:hypothetical protein [Candidatus Competibacteraceae bacterium]